MVCAFPRVRVRTDGAELGQHVARVHVQHDECAERGAVLLGELAAHQRHDVVDLPVVLLQVILKSLRHNTSLSFCSRSCARRRARSSRERLRAMLFASIPSVTLFVRRVCARSFQSGSSSRIRLLATALVRIVIVFDVHVIAFVLVFVLTMIVCSHPFFFASSSCSCSRSCVRARFRSCRYRVVNACSCAHLLASPDGLVDLGRPVQLADAQHCLAWPVPHPLHALGLRVHVHGLENYLQTTTTSFHGCCQGTE